MKPDVHYRAHKIPLLVSNLSQFNPIYTLALQETSSELKNLLSDFITTT
jgi:hypothetical protein